MNRNEVVLTGRLAAVPDERELPSGDRIATWRVIVRRPPRDKSGVRVDSIPCVTFDPGLRELVEGWSERDIVEVTGVLRRRFWRSPGGGQGGMIEVEARDVRKLEPESLCQEPPVPAPPRPVSSLLSATPTGTAATGTAATGTAATGTAATGTQTETTAAGTSGEDDIGAGGRDREGALVEERAR